MRLLIVLGLLCGAFTVQAAPLELVLQAGHSKDIKTLSLSADGKLLASGSDDGSAILWDATAGHVLRRFTEHRDKVTTVSISADGQFLATGSDDRSVILWKTTTGEKLHTLKTGLSLITAVAFHPDGKQLACASWNKDVVVFDVATGELAKALRGHTSRVDCLDWVDDGKLLLTGSWDNSAILWDVAKEEALRTCKEHTNRVKSVRISSNGKQFVTTAGKTITIWDRNQEKPVRKLTGDFGDFYAACFTDDRAYILAVGYDHNFYVWNATTGERAYPKIEADSASGGYAVVSSPDSKEFYVATRLDGIHVYDTAKGKLLRKLKSQGTPLQDLSLSADGKRLALGFDKPVAVVWDMVKGQPWHTFRGLDERGGMAAMALRPDGERLVAMCTQYALAAWDVTKKEKIAGIQHRNMPFQIAFRGDGKQFTVTNAHSVTVCEGDKGAIEKGLASSGAFISAACLSPDGSLLITGESMAACQLWDAKENKKLFDLRGHSNSVMRAAFRPDGKQAATGSVDGKAMLWDVKTGMKVHAFDGRGYVSRLAFSADSKLILLGTGNVALLYDVDKGTLVQTFAGHLGNVTGVGFGPDGKRIATASADGTVRLWDTATGKELAAILSVDQGKEWAVVTPEGTFDGSPAGLQALTFREAGTLKLSTTEQHKDQQKPGLLAKVWGVK